MIRYRRSVSTVALLTLLLGACSARVLASTSHTTSRPGCPSRSLCDTALGVALVVPPGWRLLPTRGYLPHTLVFGTRPAGAGAGRLRLVIEPFALASGPNAADRVASKIIQAEGVGGVTRFTVTYASTRAVLVRGLPGRPRPAATLFLARGQDVYRIIAPGRSLAPAQRHVLASLRFIHRTGYFLPPVGGGGR